MREFSRTSRMQGTPNFSTSQEREGPSSVQGPCDTYKMDTDHSSTSLLPGPKGRRSEIGVPPVSFFFVRQREVSIFIRSSLLVTLQMSPLVSLLHKILFLWSESTVSTHTSGRTSVPSLTTEDLPGGPDTTTTDTTCNRDRRVGRGGTREGTSSSVFLLSHPDPTTKVHPPRPSPSSRNNNPSPQTQ